MAKSTKYFVLIVALVIGGTRYMNSNMNRTNVNNDIGIWDTDAKDGQRLTVVTRSKDTGGEYYVVHSYCTQKALAFYPDKPCSLPMHLHAAQDEELQAVSGEVTVNLNGTLVPLLSGAKLRVPAGTPHTWWNSGPGAAEVRTTCGPGAPDEAFLENMAGLAHQFNGLNKVNPLQLVLLLSDANVTLTEVPPPLWAAARAVVVPLARAMGFRSSYPAYVSKAGQPVPIGQAPVHPAAGQEAVPPPAVVSPVEEEAVAEEQEVVAVGGVEAEVVAAPVEVAVEGDVGSVPEVAEEVVPEVKEEAAGTGAEEVA